MRIVNVYEVEPATGGSRLRHALEVSGPIGRVPRWVGLGRFYKRLLDREVARVAMIAAATAQARTRASRETP